MTELKITKHQENWNDHVYRLVDEQENALYQHVCSSDTYALSDLVSNRPNRIEELNEKYGEFHVVQLNGDIWRP